MNFGCGVCGRLAASSVVPTKRYNEYTKRLYQDYVSSTYTGNNDNDCAKGILTSEDWPLTIKNEKLVNTTVGYAQNNINRLPKLSRRLKKRAGIGLARNNVGYASIAVVLFIKIMKEANSSIAINFYIENLIDVIKMLLQSHNVCLRYQGLRLLKTFLEQPYFLENHSSIVHFKLLLSLSGLTCDTILQNFLEEELSNSGVGDQTWMSKIRQNTTSASLIIVSIYLDLICKFKLGMAEEESVYHFAAKLFCQQLLRNRGHIHMDNVSAFEAQNMMPSSFERVCLSMGKCFREPNTANTSAKHILEHLSPQNMKEDTIYELFRVLMKNIELAHGNLVHLFLSLLAGCKQAFNDDFERGEKLTNFVLDLIIQEAKYPLRDLICEIFDLWLLLQTHRFDNVGVDMKEKLITTLVESVQSSGIKTGMEALFKSIIEDLQLSGTYSPSRLQSVLESLESRGIKIAIDNMKLKIKLISSEKNVVIDGGIISPYQSQMLLESVMYELAMER